MSFRQTLAYYGIRWLPWITTPACGIFAVVVDDLMQTKIAEKRARITSNGSVANDVAGGLIGASIELTCLIPSLFRCAVIFTGFSIVGMVGGCLCRRYIKRTGYYNAIKIRKSE